MNFTLLLTGPFRLFSLTILAGAMLPAIASAAPTSGPSGPDKMIASTGVGGTSVLSTASYRATLPLSCGGGSCSATFPVVAAKHQLNISHMHCYMSLNANGKALEAFLDVDGYFIDIGLQWERVDSKNIRRFTFASPTSFYVRAGTIPKMKIYYEGGSVASNHCTMLGEMLTLK